MLLLGLLVYEAYRRWPATAATAPQSPDATVAWAVLGILGLVADLHMLLGAITPRYRACNDKEEEELHDEEEEDCDDQAEDDQEKLCMQLSVEEEREVQEAEEESQPVCIEEEAAGVEQGNQSGGLEKVAPVSEVQLSTCERHTQHEELLNVAQTVLSVVQGQQKSQPRARERLSGARQPREEDVGALLTAATPFLSQRWVVEDAGSVIFEEAEDEAHYHRRRSEALGVVMKVYSALRQERERILQIQEAGAALLEEFDRLQHKNTELTGDVAYWKSMTEEAMSLMDATGSEVGRIAGKGGA
mmetsp:Transcript_50626/g.118257  ORF Transcript_50626/g.118257 Transcript_50626/m.118257 type:complete len:302 (-) Transcript_50626:23-928(-)